MAKRYADAIVLLSSDDDADKTFSLSSRSRSKPKASLLTRSEPSRRKKPRVSSSASGRLHQKNIIDEFQFFGEDFKDVFTGAKVSAGFRKSEKQELWVDKYKPSGLQELAVHKKKVDEVKAWIEGKMSPYKNTNGNHVLLITGQAGVGKSATVRCIASLLGATLFEWNTPTPTVWQEHIYSSNAGASYISKLEEFEIFVEKVRNYGLLSPGLAGRSSSPVIVLIDDLPLAFGRIAFKRLQNCLHLLVQFASTPTIILITDCGRSDSADDTARHLEELRLFLENAGAYKIAFNPITNNSIKKTLSRICRQEQCDVIAEHLDIIATASGGDIRQAITSLQLSCFEADQAPCSSQSDYTCARHEDSPSRLTSHFGRDETLGLFHALGKFLHNKRESEYTSFQDSEDPFPIQDKFRRLPLKMDSPEKVLHQAHGQARPIAEFLHENAIDFIDVDAIDDAWTVLSYLVDADVLLSSSHRSFGRSNDAESVLQSVAASIATRGVLFGNCHPSPSRWHSIRKPKLWQVEKSILYNKEQMVRQKEGFVGQGRCSYDFAVFASEYLPVFKQQQMIQCNKAPSPSVLGREEEEEDVMMFGGIDDDDSMVGSDMQDCDSEMSDDEIEDW